MNILLTNDDGFNSAGILALKEVLKEYGEVYTFAPKSPQSGCGASLHTSNPVGIERIDDYNYIIDGSPVDCVQIASVILKHKKIDLIVSGLNWGYNLSNDTMYSGTCSACFQALIFRTKSIAFSTNKFNTPLSITKYGKEIMDYILSNDLLSKKYYLNVNLPDIEKYPTYKGIKITELFIRKTHYTKEYYNKKTEMIQIHYIHNDITNDDTYDVSAVENGYISITPMSLINYKRSDYKKVLKKVSN